MKENFNFEKEFQETPKKKSYADIDLGLDFDLSFLDDVDESVLDADLAELSEEPEILVKKPPVKKEALAKKPAAEKAAEAPKKAKKPAAPVQEGDAAAPVKKAKKPAPKAAPGAEGAAPAKKAAGKKPQPASQEEAPKPKKKQKKGPRVGGVIFYTLYFLFILLFFVATYFGLQWLNGWLTDYELAQPTVKAEQVFREVFTDPDWAALYDAAGAQDSPYEGKEEYVVYMEEKVGDTPLTYMETSAGLSGDKKYIVRLGDEKVASFTLKDKNKVGNVSLENLENITDIPDWQLGAVEVFFQREDTYFIVKLDGHTAQVNGVALDDTFTIQMATTKALEYLPEGTVGASIHTQQISGLMETPTVTIFDKDGKQMEVTYDEATKTFTERTESNTMTEDQKEVALDAAKTYCLYMIEEVNDRGTIAKYFDPSSKTYDTIISMYSERWMQGNKGYEFTTAEVSNFAGYGEDLFSIRVKLNMVVTRNNGTTKDYPFEQTLFFQKQDSGKWLCFEMMNMDVSVPVGKVRLTFKQGDTELFSDFFSTDAKEIVTPKISVAEGKVFTGWVTITENADGTTVYNLEFEPDETGMVTLPEGSVLKPMTLYALVQDAGAVQEVTPAETTEGA